MTRKRATIRWLLVLGVFAGVALAGCLGDQAPGDEPGTEDGNESDEVGPPSVLDWWVHDCRAVVAVIPTQADAVAEKLPEGFEPVSAEEALGLPPDPRGEGAVMLETFHCASGSGLDDEVEDFGYGAVFTAVASPEGYDDQGAELVLYKWDTLIPDEDRRSFLVERGLPAVDGETDLSDFMTTPTGAHVFEASLTLDGATFTFSGTAPDPNEAFREGFTFIEYQQGNEGIGHWISYENEASEGNSGTGTVELDPDHWTSDVVGETTTQAYMVASPSVTFSEGEIQLP